MAFGKWNAVIEELRVQREEQRNELRVQREQQRNELREQRESWERQFEENRRADEKERELSRRVYREGMDLCAHLIERSAAASDEHSHVVRELLDVIRDMRQEIQANTRAVLAVIDRMDRLDGGGAQPA